MATRTPHTGVAGEVLTAASLAKYPKGWLGWAQVTASQAGIGTTATDLTGLSLSVTVGADRLIRVSGQGQGNPSGTSEITISIVEDGTNIGRVGKSVPVTGSVVQMAGSVTKAPTAGAHTYKLQGSSSSGTFTLEATATVPAFIVVEDLGPAS